MNSDLFPIGERIMLPRHFHGPGVLEAVRQIGAGFECWVRLADGPPDEAILSAEIVGVTFSANRDQLFTAWNAVANLADLAGKVQVSLRAESETGFERGKLQNGVIEPLREADLIE